MRVVNSTSFQKEACIPSGPGAELAEISEKATIIIMRVSNASDFFKCYILLFYYVYAFSNCYVI